MKKMLTLAVAILAAVAFAGQKTEKVDFQAFCKKAELAFEKRDLAFFKNSTTADFTETSMGQTLNKQQSLDGMKQFLAMFKTMDATFKVKKATITGNTAVTLESAKITGTTQPDPKTKKSAKIVATRDEKITWVKQDGKWLVKSVVASNEKMLLNGKPYNPGG